MGQLARQGLTDYQEDPDHQEVLDRPDLQAFQVLKAIQVRLEHKASGETQVNHS